MAVQGWRRGLLSTPNWDFEEPLVLWKEFWSFEELFKV